MSYKERLVWVVFGLYVVSQIAVALWWRHDVRLDFSVSPGLSIIAFVPALILLVVHGWAVLGAKRAAGFIIWAMAVGLAAEVAGLCYGVLFGGMYEYNLLGPAPFGVPLLIIFYWAAFTYTGYSVISSFLNWRNKAKPLRVNGTWLLLLGLIIADALMVTAFDIMLEPLQVSLGSWSWAGGGAYYGIPIGNFIGWFIVAAIICGGFRLYEYFFPHQEKVSETIILMPVLGSGLLFLTLATIAFERGFTLTGILGLVFLILIAVNLALFFRRARG